MKITITTRNLVRITSFSLAAALILGGIALQQYAAARDYRMQLENTYARSLGELSSYLTNISADLDKGRYLGTSTQIAQMSARIWKESGGAKSALSTLPTQGLHMDNTYRFLSQVGDYALSLSKKVADGGELTDEEKQNAESLRQYAAKLREYVDQVQQQVRDGHVDITALPTPKHGEQTEGTRITGVAAGFEDVEQTMTGYPTLIYDGPFSDHLLERRPRMTRQMELIDAQQAKAAAAVAANLEINDLKRRDDENSKMPSYTFSAGDISIGITKAGGLVTYLINAREVGEQRLRNNAAFDNAAKYLEKLGIPNMRATYYEINDGVCVINYAAMNGAVTMYTDLIKVGVAMDDGSIVFFDARGYITNHYDRTLAAPAITPEQARSSVNSTLKIISEREALIPTSGLNEVYCYEFLCEDQDGQQVLVYVNTQNGAEEQILLLIQTPFGTLTK